MYDGFYDYSYYDGTHAKTHNRRCIDGSITGCGKCVGYCQFAEHEGFLTESLRKKHQCVEKSCHYYLSKPKQERASHHKDNHSTEIISIASELLSALEGLKVLRADKGEDGWKLKYITITNDYSIASIEKDISDVLGETVTMINLNYDFETAAKVLFSY